MKSILLTSTALVAFAGAAAADGHAAVSNAFSATIGYNDENDGIGEDGFFWEGNLKTTATAALDNGLTAGAYFEVTVGQENGTANDDGGLDLVASDFVLSLESETASLFFGDTGTAADKHWDSAGDMEQDGFTSGTDSAVLRGDATFGGVDASISYIVDDANQEVEQLSFGAGASFGAISLSAGYQEESDFVDSNGDYNGDEIFGVSAAGTFAGATVTVAYAENSTDGEDSTGIEVAYPFGPVTATAYYVDESNGDANVGLTLAYASGPIDVSLKVRDEQGRSEYNLEGSYDVGNGLTVLAGVLNENEEDVDYYIAADYDLGGGAMASFSYAEDDDGDQGDEIGAGEYDPGVTIKVTFEF
jgi:hypothetical protein